MGEHSLRIQITKVKLPEGRLASSAFSRPDYWDGHSVLLPQGVDVEVGTLARVFVASFTERKVVRLISRLGAIFGLRRRDRLTRPNLTDPVERGESIGFFRVFDRSRTEILMGEDQPHLDFRVSVLVEDVDGQTSVTVATILRYNNLVGRAYFWLIRPFHLWIMRSMLRGALDRICSDERLRQPKS